jgi:orotate phosphoribosyltransferase
MSREYVTPEQKLQLLDAAVEFGDFTLASGEKADQKFDFDRIQDELFVVAVNGLAVCIQENFDPSDFDTIVTIAHGANRLGDPLADILGKRHIPSRKASGTKQFYFDMLTQERRAVFVDDVFSKGTNMNAVSRVYYGQKIGAAVLLDRSGKANPILMDGTPVVSVMQHKLS